MRYSREHKAQNHEKILSVAKEQRYVIGIDIGGTKVMAVLFDAQFRPLGKFRTKTRPNEGEKHFIRIRAGNRSGQSGKHGSSGRPRRCVDVDNEAAVLNN